MKVETTEKKPKLDLTSPDGTRTQGHAEDVTDVLLADHKWYEIVSGSFKFYKTGKGVPFIQFDSYLHPTESNGDRRYRRMEVFPASVMGLAYKHSVEDETDEADFNAEPFNG